ncbi:MAG TPA: ectonucleotide pyrophosphatase/phosphodiesterase [Pyrinomonadaceae bacterium]
MNNRRTSYFIAILLVAALSLSLALPSGAAAQHAQTQAKRVIIISLDGLDIRYLQKRDEYGLKIPALRRLMNDGVLAEVVGVYPSVTYPSHTTIVTGAYPARHGVYNNEIFETPERTRTGTWYWYARDIRIETLWDAATKAGLSTAMISWPVSVGAGDYNFPEIFKIGGTREESFALMKANARPMDLVSELEKLDPQLYSSVNADESDDLRTRFAEYVIAEKRPQVVLIHLFDLDHFEHDKGPFTPEAFEMLEKVDGYVARILDAARRAGTHDETAVFIVSDHGFMPVSKRIYPGVILARAGLVKVSKEKDAKGKESEVVTDWRAVPYLSGGYCGIILRDPKDADAYNKALAAFKEFANNEGRGSLRVIEQKELKSLRSNPNVAFTLDAAEGYYFNNGYTGEAINSGKLRGQHGYLPGRYYTSFIASGAGVSRRGSLGTIRLIDEGPTIARVLGLKLRDAEGRALSLK